MDCEKEAFESFMAGKSGISCERVVFLVREKNLSKKEKEFVHEVEFILPYRKDNFAKQVEAI